MTYFFLCTREAAASEPLAGAAANDSKVQNRRIKAAALRLLERINLTIIAREVHYVAGKHRNGLHCSLETSTPDHVASSNVKIKSPTFLTTDNSVANDGRRGDD